LDRPAKRKIAKILIGFEAESTSRPDIEVKKVVIFVLAPLARGSISCVSDWVLV